MLHLIITLEPRDDQQVKIIAEFDVEMFEKFKRRAARKISQEAKIPGFRPGKAPYEVVKRLYGEDIIDKEAIEILIDEIYPEVLKQAEVKPSGSGTLEEIIQINPPKLAFIVPLQPEVLLIDYRAIRMDYQLEPVTDEDVNRVLKNLLLNYSTAETAERPARIGDLVYLKVSGILVTPEEGKEPLVFQETPKQVIIGNKDFQEKDWPFEGFSEYLVGMSAKEEKKVIYSFPEDFDDEEIKGKQVEFTIKVQSIKAMRFPELNDEFAQSVGEYGTIDALKAEIRSSLETSRQKEYDEAYVAKLLEQIVAGSIIKYPPQMLEDEIEQVLHSFEEYLAEQKLDLETHLKTLQVDKKTYVEDTLKPIAVKRLVRSLVIDAIANKENIRITKEELTTTVDATISGLAKNPDFKIPRGMTSEEIVSAITYQTISRMVNERVLELIRDLGRGIVQTPTPGNEEIIETTAEDVAEPQPETADGISEVIEQSQPENLITPEDHQPLSSDPIEPAETQAPLSNI